MKELKPCPFCGRKPILMMIQNEYGVILEHISKMCLVGNIQKQFSDEEYAIESWNERVTDKNEVISYLESMIEDINKRINNNKKDNLEDRQEIIFDFELSGCISMIIKGISEQ